MKAKVEKIYQLSNLEKGILFHAIESKDSKAYFEEMIMDITGYIDVDAMEKSLNEIIKRHEILRSSFTYKTDEPLHVILDKREIELKYEDITEYNIKDKEEYVKRFIKENEERKFDITKDTLMRAAIIKTDDRAYQFILSFHHIVADGWSSDIILNELITIYSQIIKGEKIKLNSVKQYSDYINWLNKQDKDLAIKYWKDYLEGYNQEVFLPMGKENSNKPYKRGERTIEFSKEFTHRFKDFASKNNVTPNIVIQSVWALLLAKYNNTNDVCFGTVTSGRNVDIDGIEKVVGLFINTIPTRVKLEDESTFKDILKKSQKEFIENSDKSYVSLADIQASTVLKSNLINHIMVFENYAVDKSVNNDDTSSIGFKINKVGGEENTNYNFNILAALDEKLQLLLIYDSNVYDKEIIDNMERHINKILNLVMDNEDLKISDINIVTQEEIDILENTVNNTKTNYPKDKTINELFEEQVEKNPDNIAVVFEGKTLTYKELNEKANEVANILRDKGIDSESIVGIKVDRSLEMMVGIMAILKSGAGYLPIDTKAPKDRTKYMIKDSKVKILLTKEQFVDEDNKDLEYIILDVDKIKGSTNNLETINKSDDVAYIIYTSGSTGNPKGVIINHYSAVRVVKDTNYIHITNKDVILQLSNYSFDGSIFDIYGALLNGAKLVMLRKETVLDLSKLSKLIKDEKVTISFMTTALFNTIVDMDISCFDGLRKILFGGERVTVKYVEKAVKYLGKDRILHVYGPTESTVYATYYPINKVEEGSKTIPIGKPLANTKLYVLDQKGNIVPKGVEGELCIAGDGLSRGYLNNQELTDKKFVDNKRIGNQKIYKTGDLVKMLPDGNIEFIGRIDNQVKIRGHRVELGEIENELIKKAFIRDVAVIAKQEVSGTYNICAYIVADENINLEEIRSGLSRNLPKYMIPSVFVKLDKMPLTKNGKIDKKALPEPDYEANLEAEYEGARNEIEEKLVAIWEEVLSVKHIGINDDFFDLGGHSLKATTLTGKIHKALNVEVPIKEIFKGRTIKSISKYIESIDESKYEGIKKVKVQEYYEASSSQKRMFMLQELDKNSVAYNMPGILELTGEIDLEKIKSIFIKLIERHETLRTSFAVKNEKIVQKVHNINEIDLPFTVVSANDEEEVKGKINSFIKPFNLEQAPLLRIEVIKAKNNRHIVVCDMHHIVADGVSIAILTKDFNKLYKGEELPELKIQYKDYSAWQLKRRESDVLKKQEKYWLKEFSGEIPVLNINTDYPRPKVKDFNGRNINLVLDKDITNSLRKIAKETGSTMYMILLANISILLSKYSGQEDIVIGSPISGRNHKDLEDIMGVFINTLAIRNYVDGNLTFVDYLNNVKKKSLSAFENQEYQFEELVENIGVARDLSRNPLFDVMFILQNIDSEALEINNSSSNIYTQDDALEKFDMTITAGERNEDILINFSYSSSLYKKETIELMMKHFVNILRAVTSNEKVKINDIDIIDENEKVSILKEFSNTNLNYGKGKTIHELFENQVEKTPDSIAVTFKGKNVTYKELNEKANSLAKILQEKGVKPDVIVGIMARRSIEMVIGILAILKSGGAYLPIDPEYPKERIDYILTNSKAKILLTESDFIDIVKDSVEIIDLKNKNIYKGEKDNLGVTSREENLAYVIYTSGSTGNPKGVMLEHRNATNFISGIVDKIEINKDKNILALTTICFDIFFLEVVLPLTQGLKVIVADSTEQTDAEKLSKFILENNIDVIQATPSRLQLLINSKVGLDCLNNVKKLLVGGEALPNSLFLKLKKLKNTRLFNMYGPTETTVWSTIKELTKEENITIGRAINNTKIYILGKNNNLNPIGVAGELCIGGDGVARGYFNNEKLTAERFIDDPFEAERKVYKTGDLARYLPNGDIEFLGRMDYQVKIRGFRIELEEIENSLIKIDGMKETVVVDKAKEDTKYLCAYYVSSKDYTIGELRNKLKEKLPDYMIPSYFIKLDSMPLTPNGKIDKKKLPEPKGDIDTGAKYEDPRNELEKKLESIWKEVLGVSSISINDNFFELGGHSLKATALISKINKELNIEVPLKAIFNTGNIKSLGEFIKSLDKKEYEAIEKVEEQEYYEASSAQTRIYLLQELDRSSTHYNMPGFLEITGEVNLDKLKNTLRKLIERHEVLRTSFYLKNNKIVQKVNAMEEIDINIEEIFVEKEEEIKNNIKPFNLEKAPLIRAAIINLNNEKTILMIDMHHIVSDGISLGILTRDFNCIYKGENLSELKVQYKDYSAWQLKNRKSEKFNKEKEYWINEFSTDAPVLNIPTDYPRLKVKDFKGDNIRFTVEHNITESLRNLARVSGCTMNMVLMAFFSVLLSKYSGQDDIVIGTPISGRNHKDLEDTIGMFVNTLAIRNKVDSNLTFNEYLRNVKEKSIMAYENQDYQFDELVESLDVPRDLSRNPLFDVMFVYERLVKEDLELDSLELKPYEQEANIEKFDFTMTAVEEDDLININLSYASSLYKKETVERIINHFLGLLKNIEANNEIAIKDIEIIDDVEKNTLLNEFNETHIYYPKDKMIYELIERQAEKTPYNVALTFENKEVTYKKLNEKANALGRILRQKGIGDNDIVAIMMDRSIELMISILAVLKSGGAYLPIDPDYPKDRVNYILKDSKAKIVLTEKLYKEKVESESEIIDINSLELSELNKSNLSKVNNVDSLAYVIYTSGTTGNPKGVMIQHKALMNYASYAKEKYFNEERLIMPLYTSISFDLTITTTFVPLISNGIVAIYKEKELDKLINKVFTDEGKKIIKVTPAHLSLLKEIDGLNKSIIKFIVGGEDLTEDLAKSISGLFGNKIEIINEYGPTESTVGCIVHKFNNNLKYNNSVLIGKPINNTKVYIVDSNNKLVPIGVTGEICIGSDSLAKGYFNNEKLTEEKFINNPYDIGKKMYRTGDLGRWLPNGEIECLGRIDHQVKIRGFRIELGEIESNLLKVDGIKEVIVLDKDNSKYLCAYYVSEKEYTTNELREILNDTLPDYMIPASFVKLETMPLTQNGKVDRRALPEPEINKNNEYEAPRNEVESKLVAIWEDILNIKEIGINNNFFEIGGHSLRATALTSRIYKEFGIRIALSSIFENPTIKELSKLVLKEDKREVPSISKVEKKDYYDVSAAQRRLYVIDKLKTAGISYNIPLVMKINGNLDIERFNKAINKLIERHEALRTSFRMVDGNLVQKIEDKIDFNLKVSKLTNGNINEKIKEFIKPFDLGIAPLFRMEIVKEDDNNNIMLFDIHHIISDGVSTEILFNDLIKLYKGESLEEVDISYKDYVYWQNSLYASEKVEKEKNYWLKVFEGELPVLNLPLDYPRPKVKDNEGDVFRFNLNEDLTMGLRKIAKEKESTMFMMLLSAYTILLSKYTGQDDIIVGSPIAGRQNEEVKDVVGLFLNTLAIRNNPESNKTFIEYLKEVKENCLKGYENQDYPFDELVEQLNLERDTSRSVLFDVMLTLQNYESKDIKSDELSFERYNLESNVAKFDLNLTATETDNNISFALSYSTRLFKKSRIEKLGEYFVNIIENIIKEPNNKIKDIKMISDNEINLIKKESKGQSEKIPMNKHVYEIFEEQAKKTPSKVAVVSGEEKITYKELNEKANRLARFLKDNDVNRGDIVALMFDESIDMVVAILAVLKARAIYLPIDIKQNIGRTNEILKDSKAKLILSNKDKEDLLEFDGEYKNIYAFDAKEYMHTNIKDSEYEDDDIYLIYTSGSTGKPKGVVVKNSNLLNYINWFTNEANITDKDKTMLMSSYAFDLGYTIIYSALLRGSELHIEKRDLYTNPIKCLNYIRENKISYIKLTPPLFNILVNDEEFKVSNNLESLRLVVLGGEKINVEDLEKLYKKYPEVIVMNHYGPTETTIGTVFKTINSKEFNEFKACPVIGNPINNAAAYIVDKDMNLVPKGVYGELCISGLGVSKGYLNEEDLTKNSFVNNLFDNNSKLYKTGDIVRRLDNGTIELQGRIDNQVKIRGYRVETQEIENKLLKMEEVKEAIVLPKEDKLNNKVLCAYITGNKKVTFEEVREYLKGVLPEYMIPSYVKQINKMPINNNGKIDKKLLPDIDFNKVNSEKYEAPRNEAEEKITNIWGEVLGIDSKDIGINSNFFVLGGDSIKALQIISRMMRQGMEIQIKDIFDYPEIKDLSTHVKFIESGDSKKEIVEGKVNLTPIQEAYFSTNKREVNHYCQSAMLYRKDGFNKDYIEDIFKEIVKNHDALRMKFTIEENKVIEYNRGLEEGIVNIEEYDIRNEENPRVKVEELANKLQNQINITEGVMFKTAIFKTNEGDHLLIIIHHLVVDGVSWRILFEDLKTGYNQLLEGKKLELYFSSDSYMKYSSKLQEYSKSNKLEREREYWQEISREDVGFLKDKVNISEFKIEDFDSISTSMSENKTEDLLRKTNKAYNTEINDILITSLVIASRKITGKEVLKIEMEGHGRQDVLENIDISRTVGWFTCKYPVLLDLNKEKDISMNIKEVKETLRRVPNKGIGYGILKYLDKDEVIYNSAHPVILFNYLGQMDEDIVSDVFVPSDLSSGKGMGKDIVRDNSIEIAAIIVEGKLTIRVSYNTKVYEKAEVEEFLSKFKESISEVVSHCAGKKESEKTPSDYGDKTISLIELEDIKTRYKNFEIEKIYPLANMQVGMLFHALENKNSTAYFEQMILDIEGYVDEKIFEESLEKIVSRHEALRTSFEYDITTEPKNIILKNRKADFEYIDLRNSDEVFEDYIERDKKKGFDLSNDRLIRLQLIRLTDNEYKAIWSNHHIILDGWGRGIILSELLNIYKNKLNDEDYELKPVKPYSSYINWHQKQDKNLAKKYWEKYLEGYEEPASLPKEVSLIKEDRYEYKERLIEFSDKWSKDINNIAAKNNVTINTVLQMIWSIVLSKYNSRDDVVFGKVVSGRNGQVDGIEQMVGLFINTIPTRCTLDKNSSFSDNVKKLQREALECNNYDYMNLSEIQSQSKLKQNLIDHIIVFENYAVDEMKGTNNYNELGFKINRMSADEQNNYDFTIVALPGDTFKLKFIYNGYIYEEKFIENVENHIREVSRQIIENENMKIKDIKVISKKEIESLVVKYNDTKASYDKEKTIYELFEEQVKKTPYDIAVNFEDETLTYKELNNKANYLAKVLREKGVRNNTIVGIMLEPSKEMIIGIMAILKAGGAYMPIDPKYPNERKEYMLQNSKAELLIVKEKVNFNFSKEIITINEKEIDTLEENLKAISGPEDLVYIIYTSGSTGRPKGVMIKERGLVNYITWASKNYLRGDKLDFPLYSSFAFDLTVTSIFTPLVTGNSIRIYFEKDNEILIRRIFEENKVGIVKLTPAHLNLIKDMNNKESSIKRLIVGGEDLKVQLAKEIDESFGHDIEIYNEYGPTETVVGCMIHKYDPKNDTSASVPIGIPADNVQIYILDENMNAVPYGVKGEMYIGGDGVAKGYLNNPELTAKSFIDNPYSKGEKLYKTGDTAKFLLTGEIEYLGRIDNQVKIHGFRIETGEIEDRLLKNPKVKDAVVIDRKDKFNDKYLCAYLVLDENYGEEEVLEVKELLKKQLPSYMIPSYFIKLEKIELTTNGKVDRSKLPEPNKNIVTNVKYEAPRNEMDEMLISIWKEILEVKDIGINDDLFQIGANSLNILSFVSKLAIKIKYRLPFKNIFENPTVKSLSDFIENANNILKDCIVDYVQLTKSEDENKVIFCFPPVASLAIGYMEFAKYLEGYSVYSFNFIKSENRIKEYVNTMKKLQPKGSYVLMGYSSGGNLAFDVAKELINQGNEVKDIILLDSRFRTEVQEHVMTKEEWKQALYDKYDLEKYEETEMLVSDYSVDMIMTYLMYVDCSKTTGTVDANITFINSEKEFDDARMFKWKEATTREFKIVQGFGTHYQMITTNNRSVTQKEIDIIKNNADIVREILNR